MNIPRLTLHGIASVKTTLSHSYVDPDFCHTIFMVVNEDGSIQAEIELYSKMPVLFVNVETVLAPGQRSKVPDVA